MNTAVAVKPQSKAVAKAASTSIAPIAAPSKQQTLTVIGMKSYNGSMELLSEREGSTWRRSITIEANNLPLLIQALSKLDAAIKAGKVPVGIAVIKNGTLV